MFVCIVPLLWLLSGDVLYLILVQVFSGLAWAGFNLSTANFMYDNVKPGNRTRVFSYHNVLNGTLVFGGAVLGGLLSKVLTSPWVFYSSLQILFLISGVLRAVMSLIFLPLIREVRGVEQITDRDFFLRYSGTGPVAGLTFKTVTGLSHSIKQIGGRWIPHKTPLR
jgi:MFS family permease